MKNKGKRIKQLEREVQDLRDAVSLMNKPPASMSAADRKNEVSSLVDNVDKETNDG